MVGYFTCYGTTNIASSFQWRLPFILLATLSLIYSASIATLLPHSPRWLSLHGRVQEASAAWDVLGVQAADREKIEDQLENIIELTPPTDSNASNADAEQATSVPRAPKKKGSAFLEVFSHDARPRFLLAVFLMGMQQLSGIDGVLYVSHYPSFYSSPSSSSSPSGQKLTSRTSTHRSSSNKQA